jgi:hypothetical protein
MAYEMETAKPDPREDDFDSRSPQLTQTIEHRFTMRSVVVQGETMAARAKKARDN